MIEDPKLDEFFARFAFHLIPFTREIKVKDRFQSVVYDEPLIHLQRTISKSMSGRKGGTGTL